MKDNNVNIAFTDLKKTYENKANKTSIKALHIPGEINIMKGQVTTILGYSASGKSTLLNLLALIDKPDEDKPPSRIKVYYLNNLQDVSDLKENDIVAIRKRYFGFIFQSGHLLSHFKTGQNIAVPLYLNEHSDVDTEKRADYLLNKAFPHDATNADTNHNESNSSNATDTKLTPDKDPREQYPITLSGGQYLRTAVMRGISHNPKILFADEPTGNLDPATGKIIMEHIINGWMDQDDRAEKSLIMVTHDYAHAYNYSDRILVLADGNLVMDFRRNEYEDSHKFTGKSFTKNVDGKMSFERIVLEDNIVLEDDNDLLKRVEEISGKKDPDKAGGASHTVKSSVSDANQFKSSLLFKFSLKYAIKELCYKKNLPLTIMNVATIMILIISVLVIGGIFCGTKRFLDASAVKNPMLKRMLFFASVGSSGGKISSDKITTKHIDKIMSLKSESGSAYFSKLFQGKKKLRLQSVINYECSACNHTFKLFPGKKKRLEKQCPKCGKLKVKRLFMSWLEGDVIDKALPFYEQRIRLYNADGTENLGGKAGRTVHKEDPLLKYLKFTAEGIKGSDIYRDTFKGLDFKGIRKGFPFGIIISQRTIKELGYTEWECSVCGYIYDPEKGDGINGIPSGTPFEALSDDWVCPAPACGAEKKSFQDNYTEEIYISYYGGRKVKLQVVGIATSIPGSYDFLVTDDFYAAFLANCWNQENLYNKAYLGPFTKETAGNLKNDFDKYISEVRKEFHMLQPLKVIPYPEDLVTSYNDKQSNASEERWLAFYINPKKESEYYWTQAQFNKELYIGLKINNPKGIELPDFKFPDSPFIKAGTVSKDLDEFLNTQDKFLLGAYFHNIEDMIDAAELFEREINLAFEGNIKFIKHILLIKNLGFWTFLVVSGIVSLAALCNIFLSFFQNIKGKIAEIGILRAIGASKGLVYRFYFLESVFLWVSAFLFGIAVSWPLGLFLGSLLEDFIGMAGDESLFYMQWQLILIAAGISLFFCLLGALLAVGRTIKKVTPAEAVRYQGN